jgi:transposase
MDVVHPRCAGLDVSKRDAKVCVRIQDSGRAGASSVGCRTHPEPV